MAYKWSAAGRWRPPAPERSSSTSFCDAKSTTRAVARARAPPRAAVHAPRRTWRPGRTRPRHCARRKRCAAAAAARVSSELCERWPHESWLAVRGCAHSAARSGAGAGQSTARARLPPSARPPRSARALVTAVAECRSLRPSRTAKHARRAGPARRRAHVRAQTRGAARALASAPCGPQCAGCSLECVTPARQLQPEPDARRPRAISRCAAARSPRQQARMGTYGKGREYASCSPHARGTDPPSRPPLRPSAPLARCKPFNDSRAIRADSRQARSTTPAAPTVVDRNKLQYEAMRLRAACARRAAAGSQRPKRCHRNRARRERSPSLSRSAARSRAVERAWWEAGALALQSPARRGGVLCAPLQRARGARAHRARSHERATCAAR